MKSFIKHRREVEVGMPRKCMKHNYYCFRKQSLSQRDMTHKLKAVQFSPYLLA